MHKDYAAIVASMDTASKVELVTGSGLWHTAELKKYGIPSLVMTDGTYGVRYSTAQIEQGADWSMDDFLSVVGQKSDQVQGEARQQATAEMFSKSKPATCFPNGSSAGCSWDRELMYRIGAALSEECQEFGVDILLGPGINIRRTPLAGRGYEYYAEDPVVSGELAAALIRGLQDNGTGCSLKHFACNNSEFRRTEMNSQVEARALHEIYLSGFKRAIEKGHPLTVMSSYNLLNGVQASENKFLLTDTLRRQWHFDGVVMSDWYAVKHRPQSLLAGNDLSMPETRRDKAELLQAVKDGTVPEAVLDASCIRMLKLIDTLVSRRKKGFKADFRAHHELARTLAAESAVLLKNTDHMLPLLKGGSIRRIAVIGESAIKPAIQGSGCATTVPYLLDIPLEEIRRQAGTDFDISYTAGTKEGQYDAASAAQACRLAASADAVIIFLTTPAGTSGENGDRTSLNIIEAEEQLLREIHACNSNLAAVLTNSDSVVMPWLDCCRAVLELFFAGQGMGRAVAQLLFGLKNPCGKLTVTVPNTLEETPAYLTYPGEGLNHVYSEGLFVGYRYYDRRRMQPLFPFGFGLSYTCFEYSNLQLDRTSLNEGETLQVSCEVSNTGKVAGKEVVQLYVSFPDNDGLLHEVRALKDFCKVELQPGESKKVSFALTLQDLTVWHPVLNKEVTSPGRYEVFVGASSRDLPLKGSFEAVNEPELLPVQADSSFAELIENKPAFERVVSLIADKTGLQREEVAEKLVRRAPEMFCGMFIALSELMQVEVSREELNAALRG